jgi:cell wall-associated NlpC family hydrolase
MMTCIKRLAIVLLTMYVSACGWMQAPPAPDSAETARIRQALYSQYEEWKHVRYRAGGLSKNGVDCSGFVFLTFDSRFAISLPRSTTEQVRVGREVTQRELTAGDLVFFRTGMFQRHVGIYLENRRFLHASTEKGIMISSLDDHYWSRAYWTSRRVRG